ncbi:MAG: signal peptidase I, partial [Spirochaetota bacterium]
ISEQAMSPALQKGDIVVFMRFIPPRTGDIVLYIDPLQHDTKGVRRVTAEPGSTVRITDKTVFVNSKTSEQPFQMRDDRIFPASFSSRDNLEPLTVPDGHYFLMGDNFDRSSDSRRYGSVPRDSIVGVLILSI